MELMAFPVVAIISKNKPTDPSKAKPDFFQVRSQEPGPYECLQASRPVSGHQ